MLIQSPPDTIQKLTQMGDVTLFEPAGDRPVSEEGPQRSRIPYQSQSVMECVTHLSTPKGRKPVLKTMMTTACEKDCFYCPFRAGRSQTRRMSFKPEELASTFDMMQRSGVVNGLFLSSGIIKGGITSQDKILDTVDIIRTRYNYRGYIHLKIMPGAEYDQIFRAMQIADRVSINLEAPTQQRLHALAPKKDFAGELLNRLHWAQQIRHDYAHLRLASTVTQFVVGAVDDTDLELLSLSDRLYQQIGLARAYYSAFSPVIQTPFENLTATDPKREYRLYQASFLLRDYDWEVEELPFEQQGNLRLDVDPKRAWAEQHLLCKPIDIMHAERHELMRIPGIGPCAADTILRARRDGIISDIGQLRRIGIRAPEQAAPYILLNGKRSPTQLTLF